MGLVVSHISPEPTQCTLPGAPRVRALSRRRWTHREREGVVARGKAVGRERQDGAVHGGGVRTSRIRAEPAHRVAALPLVSAGVGGGADTVSRQVDPSAAWAKP
eukprot:946272-Prorocentrum_minimum.AAC.2